MGRLKAEKPDQHLQSQVGVLANMATDRQWNTPCSSVSYNTWENTLHRDDHGSDKRVTWNEFVYVRTIESCNKQRKVSRHRKKSAHGHGIQFAHEHGQQHHNNAYDHGYGYQTMQTSVHNSVTSPIYDL